MKNKGWFNSERAKKYGFKKGNQLGRANFKGGWKDAEGYISTNRGKRTRMHRYVMEKFLGRELKKGEMVHHINGDKTDNGLENLELLTYKEHAKRHPRLRDKKGKLLPNKERR